MLAWLFARSSGSRFLVRIEDLDPATRSSLHEPGQLRDLEALGLDWDGSIVRQSERLDLYEAAIGELVYRGLTYECTCTRREVLEAASAPHGDQPEGAYPGTCLELPAAERRRRDADGRPAALRMRCGGAVGTAHDRFAGAISATLDDFVVRRNDGTPAYNLAVVVDDAAQGVGEVVRGDDLLLGTPRQVHLAGVLGLDVPAYAHVPLVVGPDGERLSKRHGAISMQDMAVGGIGSDDVRAMLAESLGLATAEERPTMVDLLEGFDPDHLPRQPWILPISGGSSPL